MLIFICQHIVIMCDTSKCSFKMNDFLERCQTNLKMLHNLESVWIVMGNESCDLDSAVCALVYALYKSCKAKLAAVNAFKEENPEFATEDFDLLRDAFLAQAVCETDIKEELHSSNLTIERQNQKVCSVTSDHCLGERSKTGFVTEMDDKLESIGCEAMFKLKKYIARKTDHVAFLPVLNVPKDKFMLKTEVTFFLKKHNIPLDKLIFRDNLNLKELERTNKLHLTLVDHHVLQPESEYLRNCVREIIDHRPQDSEAKWAEGVLHLVQTGSCATLIIEKIVNSDLHMLTREMATMLYGPIVLDTACFSTQAKRATPLDYKMAKILESVEGVNLQKDAIFNELLTARTDISTLSSFQILDKDYKIISGIPIAGLPILVQDFMKRSDWWDAIKKWSDKQHSQVTLLMGMKIENLITSRDLALVDNGNSALVMQLMDALHNSKNPDLCLLEIPVEQPYTKLFYQRNAQASRKQIVPILTSVLSCLK